MLWKSSSKLLIMTMASPTQAQNRLKSYDKAIKALNTLQTNASLLKQTVKERQRFSNLNVPRTLKFLLASGMTEAQLDALNVIHVSGTKGKGSVCAFAESVLRRRGLRTGFFSSPHLVHVTERIRINGRPIEQRKFAAYFWTVYDRIRNNPIECETEEERNCLPAIPPYFQFLTVLAYYVFHREKVDVAIMEVGVGGQLDPTNVVRKPKVCAITALGMDHTQILGETLPEIAGHKAGIMKPGVPCVIDPGQPESAWPVLTAKAARVGSIIHESPDNVTDYDWGGIPAELGLSGRVQSRNAALAVMICRIFNRETNDLSRKIDINEALGLKLTNWPGRSQVFELNEDLTFYLDGAHTIESVEACIEWFSAAASIKDSSKKVLIFNVIRGKRGEILLKMLKDKIEFNLAVFCTNMSKREDERDNSNFTTTVEEQLKGCKRHLQVWQEREGPPAVIIPYLSDAAEWILNGFPREDLAEVGHDLDRVSDSDLEGIDALNGSKCQILTTGSFHLVGGVLELICPDICFKSESDERREAEIVQQYHKCFGDK